MCRNFICQICGLTLVRLTGYNSDPVYSCPQGCFHGVHASHIKRYHILAKKKRITEESLNG